MPKTDALQQLSARGVAVWLDDLSRELLAEGLDELIEHYAVVGITTNPTIFATALARGTRYDDQLEHLALEGVSVDEAVFRITTDDVRAACDRLRTVYDATGRVNGQVSIEVDPGLAHDTEGTVEQARRLWQTVGRDNLLVKVPATAEGIPAIEHLIAEGISVNVTLIFSLSRYREVAEAYVAGLQAAAKRKLSLARIASVASFFVSRVDAEVDKRIDRDDRRTTEALRDTLYVEELVAPQTVSTMPLATLCAVADHGTIATDTITDRYEAAERTVRTAEDHGVDMAELAADLEKDGVRKFEASWQQLRETVHKRMTKLDDAQRSG